jgi:hypothetical protein
LLEVLPKRSRTTSAVGLSRFMWSIRRLENAFSLLAARLKNATTTSAVGRADKVK